MSFVLLGVVLVLGVTWIRDYTATAAVRDHESAELRDDAAVVAALVLDRESAGQPVDRAWLAGVVGSDRTATVELPSGTITAAGADYRHGGHDPVNARQSSDQVTVTLGESGAAVDELVRPDRSALAWLVLLVALVAGLVGYLVARLVSAPFVALARAADQLGRGRFELDLPRSRVPEAVTLRRALTASAGQLQERLAKEQAFAEHASHVLRTPLTGLRLDLEEIAGRDDLPDDVRTAASRSVRRVEGMDAVAGELVELSRRGALVTGAQISLADLGTQSAQTWADALGERGRTVTAAVEGDLSLTYTPGPVELVLDLLLAETVARGEGPVRMVFEAVDGGHLSIEISSAGERRAPGADVELPVTKARAVVAALGGRLRGEGPGGLTVLLPRR